MALLLAVHQGLGLSAKLNLNPEITISFGGGF
jgi:hypothetical protein